MSFCLSVHLSFYSSIFLFSCPMFLSSCFLFFFLSVFLTSGISVFLLLFCPVFCLYCILFVLSFYLSIFFLFFFLMSFCFFSLIISGCFFFYGQLSLLLQSDGNSFSGDVVSDSFNKTSLDEYSILDQIYKSAKYVHIIIMMILDLYNIIQKCILTLYSSTKTQFYEFLVVVCYISLNVHCIYILQSLLKFKIFHNKTPRESPFIF